MANDLVCGTGNWGGPLPGDPNNDIILTAVPIFGGVNVSWTYPTINPWAVAYIEVYRGSTSNFSSAIEIAKVAGNRYFDPQPLNAEILYFYWIKVISVHGTPGILIGPDEVLVTPSIENIITHLTEKIDQGVLAQELRADISRIADLADGLLDESTAREADVLSLSQVIEELQTEVDNAMAYILEEQTVRISAVDALAQQIITIQSDFGDATAAIQQQMGTLTSEQQAIAQSVTTLESELGGQLAQAQQNIQTLVNDVGNIGALYTVKLNANGLAGGFGVYNDGSEVEAGFDVDTFWVGRTGPDKKKPFIINNGVVYIDQAMIQDASIVNAKIANGSISAAKIIDGHITNAKIANGSITAVKIADANITTAKIGEAQVDTLRLAGEAVSIARSTTVAQSWGAGGYFLGTWYTIGSFVMPAGTVANSLEFILSPGSGVGYVTFTFRVLRNGGLWSPEIVDGGDFGSIDMDTTAGRTYAVQVKFNGGGTGVPVSASAVCFGIGQKR